VADRVPGHESGGELVDDGADHDVEVCDLIVQFEVAVKSLATATPIWSAPLRVDGFRLRV
jgi:hypothetical protein